MNTRSASQALRCNVYRMVSSSSRRPARKMHQNHQKHLALPTSILLCTKLALKSARSWAQKSVYNWGVTKVENSVRPLDEMSDGLLVGVTAQISGTRLVVPMARVKVENWALGSVVATVGSLAVAPVGSLARMKELAEGERMVGMTELVTGAWLDSAAAA